MNELKEITVKLKDGEDYVIVKDIAKDNDMIIGDEDSPDRYYLYFEKTFKLYNEHFRVSSSDYDDFKEGIEYYLVIKNGAKNFYDCYDSRKYKLSQEQERKIIPVEDLTKYTQLKFREVKIVEEQNVINKDTLINKLYHKKTINILLTITVCFLAINYYFYTKELIMIGFIIPNIMLIIATSIVFLINYSRKKAILDDNFRIVKDKVIKINETIEFQYTNNQIEFTLEKTHIRIVEPFIKFGNVNVGDELFLVFIKNKKKPKLVYKASTTIVELLTE